MQADPEAEADQIARLTALARRPRCAARCTRPSPRCAQAAADRREHHARLDRRAQRPGSPPANGAAAMRAAFGEYRAPTGVSRSTPRTAPKGWSRSARPSTPCRPSWAARCKFLVGKPGLDGHSNGAEQIAARARDCGMDINYEGIRLTPAEIVSRRRRTAGACRRPVDPVGQPPAADHRGAGPDARGGPVATCPWSSAASSPKRMPHPARDGRGRGLHAQGFRAEPDHDGHRGPCRSGAALAAE